MAYATVLDVARLSGIYNQAVNEAVGTGTGSATSFSLDNANVVDGSQRVYVAGAEQTEGTNYTVNNESGIITFLQAPAQDSAITADYKYFPETLDLTNADVEQLILDADSEIEEWTGKKWTSGNSETEYIEGRAELETVAMTGSENQFHRETFDEMYVILLKHYPVQSITSLQFLDDDGTVSDTLTETTDYHWWSSGKIQLIGNTIPVGKGRKKVKIIYTYGESSVPRNVKNLSAAIAGIMIFVNLTGGSFDEITSYTLGPKSVSVGEPYMNMREAINKLEQMRDRLLNQIGREFRIAAI